MTKDNSAQNKSQTKSIKVGDIPGLRQILDKFNVPEYLDLGDLKNTVQGAKENEQSKRAMANTGETPDTKLNETSTEQTINVGKSTFYSR